MTQEQARAEQERISRAGYRLEWWYGTGCEKCCGVYPRFHSSVGNEMDSCWYECDVCGKRTRRKSMPWLAEEAWNNREYLTEQVRMF